MHHIPEGFNALNAYLIVDDGQRAIEFYQNAFEAQLGDLMQMPDGTVLHAAMHVGNSAFMISHENPAWEMKSVKTLGGSPAMLHLYVPDADAAFQRALDHGCQAVTPVADCFWGERMGKVEDPFGFRWGLATVTEQLTSEEVQKRAAEFMKQMGKNTTSE